MLAVIVFADWLMSSSRFVGDLSLDTRVWMAINEKITTDYKSKKTARTKAWG